MEIFYANYVICVLVFWIMCGLIAGYLYRQRGRSELVGCIGGFILGPLGIILALVTPPDRESLAQKEKEIEEQALIRRELKKCPYCAELIRPEATVCRFCGRDIIPEHEPLTRIEEASEIQIQNNVEFKECPNCAELIHPETNFCKYCGNYIIPPPN